MDFVEFVDLLQGNALWFARLDQFLDPYEGFFPQAVRDALVECISESAVYAPFTYEAWRKRACANCWCMSDCESAAMWDLYSKENGIAICSRPSRIESAIQSNSHGPWGIYGNAVRYVAFESFQPLKDVSTGHYKLRAADLHLKRKSFEHEREYRLTSTLEQDQTDLTGKHVPVILNELVEAVHVSPIAKDWVLQVIEKEVKAHNLRVPVFRSDLYSKVK